ncbi:MAG: S-layer homology domain-containing protein [Clostridia bacterium]|nr:S-layer homology domain-containing protein [Clostridia bacterium]
MKKTFIKKRFLSLLLVIGMMLPLLSSVSLPVSAFRTPIVVKINNGPAINEFNLSEAITASGTALGEIYSLEFTDGAILTEDWEYIKNNRSSFSALTDLSVTDAVYGVENIPDFNETGFIFPTSLETVDIANVNYIGTYAFRECTNLTTANFPDTTDIGQRAFWGCTELTNINIPNVTGIWSAAFKECDNLTTVSIPVANTIWDSAFDYCSNLSTIKQSATPPTCGQSPFLNCAATRNLVIVDESGTELTGAALISAQNAYKAVDDGSTTDNFWYGWRIAPPLSSISISGTAQAGQTLTTTIAPNDATASYQWQADGVNIDGATGSTYTPTVSVLGKAITVTATGTGAFSGAVTSNPTSTVVPAAVSSIIIRTSPTKVAYTAGELLVLTGLTVTLTRADHTTQDVALSDFEENGITTVKANGAILTVTDTEVSISVNGKTFAQEITVNGIEQAVPTGLAGVTPTSALNDGKITGTTTAMEYKLSTDSVWMTVTGTEITRLTAGTYEVRYKAHGNYEASQSTTIIVPAAVSSIIIRTSPEKVTYMAGELLNLTGLTVTLTRADHTTQDVALSDFEENGITTVKANGAILAVTDTEVSISVNGKTFAQEITVNGIEQAAPTGLAGVTPTSALNDGKITGTTTAMEYKLSADSVWMTVTGTEITRLTAGTYEVRYKAHGNYEASQSTTIIVPVYTRSSHSSRNNSSNKSGNSDVDILVNGHTVNAGTVTNSTENNKTVTTLLVDQQKLKQKLVTEGNNAVVTIPIKTSSDIKKALLNGQMVKNMENEQANLEVKTETAAYTLPAQQINIDAISKQLGTNVVLKDIKVEIGIAERAQEKIKLVKNLAVKGNFTIVTPPVEFNIKCTYGNKTFNVSKFKAYVERTIAIPDGVDPTKITTGIIVDPDGTVRHVPTKIVVIDGKYYAKINSLTNSTYSVIWHPVEFADVADHWAKDAINDMGARMVVNSVDGNTYEPNRDITRAEFATAIIKALGLEPGIGNNPFSDVPNDSWYITAIMTASEYNIINGYGNGLFGPMDKITHEQAMAMVANAMKLTGLKADLNGTVEKLFTTCSNEKQTSKWAKESVDACVATGVVLEKSNIILAPKDNITRAEVAVIIQQLLQKSNLI